MRISVWSSDVCSSDLMQLSRICIWKPHQRMEGLFTVQSGVSSFRKYKQGRVLAVSLLASVAAAGVWIPQAAQAQTGGEAGVREFNIPPRALSEALADFGRQSGMQVNVDRSEEHTSELQSLMRISYAVFCLKKKKNNNKTRLSKP